MVARQFRVLEAASSSPATSTKKHRWPLRLSVFFRCGEDENSPFAHRAKSSSHSKRSREELAHLRRAIGIFSSAENPAIKLNPMRVLRRLENIVCYSAIRMRRMTQYIASGMRLRQPFPTSTPCFARARRRKQLSTVSYSLTRHFGRRKAPFSKFRKRCFSIIIYKRNGIIKP